MTERPSIAWSDLDFEWFAKLAADTRLSKYEKIGFPDSYREGYEPAIFKDILAKVPRINADRLHVVDIGPGCSDLATMIIDCCREHAHTLTLIDSEPMLALLPKAPFVELRPGLFPRNRPALADLLGKVDVIIMYSVFHYIYVDANPFDAIDLCVELLAPGGQAILGDIPNVSMRNRFFSSAAGLEFHQAFTGGSDQPPPLVDLPAPTRLDDAVVAGLLARARAAGAHAFVVPQGEGLPLRNRREDILIWKP